MSAFTLDVRPDGIAVLTFDLPGEKVNKLTTAVMEELDRLLDDLAPRHGVKALVVASGKPNSFIAGADIAEIRGITDVEQGSELARKGQSIMNKLEALPFPTVAAIHGACLGGGLELALACSHRVISNDPKTVLGLPEIKIGIMPGFGGTQRLPLLVGLVNSLDIILTGKSVHPKKAKKIGLADEVTYRETLLAAALATARRAIGTQRPTGVRARRPLGIRLLESNPLGRKLIFGRAEKNILEETRGNYPAPPAALDAVRTGLAQGSAAGYGREAALIGKLITTDVSKNLIAVFYLNEFLKRDPNPSPLNIARAGVLGAGVMGGGIAQLFAEKSIAVRMKDIAPPAVSAGLRAAADIFRKRAQKGVLDPLQARDGMDRISGTADMTGFGGVDIAVEAVVESMEIKQQVLRDFEAVAKEDAIFASNTSSLSITELASAAKRPDRVAGMHFFNPVEKMPLVEVVRGRATSNETVAAVATLARRLGKLPVVVNDGPGFLVNRILMPYLGEALVMLEEGAAIEEIDDALMQFGMPMGAFVLLDEIGIDIAHKVAGILRQGLGERMAQSSLLERLLKAGYLGRKNGKGFYMYLHGRRGGQSPLIPQMLEHRKQERKLAPGEIVDRSILLMIKEAALCLEDRIIDRPDLLDAALIFGIGFPPFRGGLLRYADSLGAQAVMKKFEALAERHGNRFAPPAALGEMSRDALIGQIVR